MTEIQTAVAQYLTDGLCLIPVPQGTKQPTIEWQQYQSRKPTEVEIANWFNGHPTNLAVICGQVSQGLVILDFDDDDQFVLYQRVFFNKTGKRLLDYTRVTRGSRGGHVWFKVRQPVKSTNFPNCEVRSDGRIVVLPPSLHPSGCQYQMLNPGIPILEIRTLADVGIDTTQKPRTNTNIPQGKPIPEGQRNATLASKAGTMRRAGFSPEAIFEALARLNQEDCQPPLPDEEVRKIAISVGKYNPATGSFGGHNEGLNGGLNTTYINIYERNKNGLDTERNKNATENATETAKTQQEPLSKKVEDWVKHSGSRWCETPELDRDLGVTSATEKNNRREILLRLEEKGIIEKHSKIQKQFRFVNKQLTPINFKVASSAGVLPLKWPLKIEEYVNLFPGNLAVVAGATNAGKTALLLNVVYLNQFRFPMPIYYFCSEMGDVELKERLEQSPGMSIEEWNFKPFDRSTDFADVIAPDCLNIVDYLEITEDLFAINTYLTSITRKLGNGLAIVAIQKKVGQKWGRGQEFSAEKSKLYLSMDERKMTIVKGKSWVNKKVNPNGLRVEFDLIRGCEFQMTREWGKPND